MSNENKKILEAIIGLEIHVQLKTKSKMFCSCDNRGENQAPNTTICPVCMGHPGVLPVVNKQAIEWGILTGLAMNGDIAKITHFDRKSYFYPDLPKGYQISQFSDPIVNGGYLEISCLSSSEDIAQKNPDKKWIHKKINLERIHLEEDAAKLLHAPTGETFVDYNRGGTPLMEVVTKPDFRSPEEAKVFLQELRLIMRTLDVSDADMEKGHLRCDANISLREVGTETLNPKTEIKNVNSFKAVEKALAYEIKRQTILWSENNLPKYQSTRGWDEAKQKTVEQRTKEDAKDYRYFPEPDLPPIHILEKAVGEKQDNEFYIEDIREQLRELPQAKRIRFAAEYGFDEGDANTLTQDRDLSSFTEETLSELRAWLLAHGEQEGTSSEIWDNNKKRLSKLVANWLLNRLLKILFDKNLEINKSTVTPENFAEFLTLIERKQINSTSAQAVLEEMVNSGLNPTQIVSEKAMGQVSDDSLISDVVNKLIEANPKVVADYKSGKVTAAKFLFGLAMREMKGKADPQAIQRILEEKLGNL